jgi:hypothetical protein
MENYKSFNSSDANKSQKNAEIQTSHMVMPIAVTNPDMVFSNKVYLS